MGIATTRYGTQYDTPQWKIVYWIAPTAAADDCGSAPISGGTVW